jgi:DNA polymerase III epsilon subunit-like protein
MREIVIDTETTGLDPLGGHRVVEIGAVELVDRSPTGKTFNHYLCPLHERRGRCARPDGPCSSSTFHLNASPSERPWSRCRFLSRSIW